MDKFLFRFGYCTPQQWQANEANDWDDESSAALFIVAPSADAALDWGTEVANAFVRKQFEIADWKGPIPTWTEGRFAHWIEELPAAHFSQEQLARLPVVRTGELPNFDNL